MFRFEAKGELASLLVLPEDKAVHGADLGDLVVGSKEPQVLLVTLLVGIQLGLDARGIVASDLGITRSAGPGTDLVRGRQQVDGVESRGEVRADGGGNDKDQGLVRCTHSKGLLGTDHGGAEVERVAATLGNPAVIDLQVLANQLDQLFVLKILQAVPEKKAIVSARYKEYTP